MTPRSIYIVAVVIGVAIGLVIPLAYTYATHPLDCVSGSVTASTGPIITPFTVAIPPPGGLIMWDVTFNASPTSGFYGETDRSLGPFNNTTVVFHVYNWTQRPVRAATEGYILGSLGCHGVVVAANPPSYTGCNSCPEAPAAPQGIGVKSVTPAEFVDLGYPSVLLNATYGPVPAATFVWNYTPSGGVSISSASDLASLFVAFGAFSVSGSVIGLGMEVHLTSTGFGVPLMNGSGPTTVIPSSVPGGLPGTRLSTLLTYIFPNSDDQGTWEVFDAGAGSAYPLGGFVFMQTA